MWTNSNPLRVCLSSTAFKALEPMSRPTTLFFLFPSMFLSREGCSFAIHDGRLVPAIQNRTKGQPRAVLVGDREKSRERPRRGGAPIGQTSAGLGVSLYNLSKYIAVFATSHF